MPSSIYSTRSGLLAHVRQTMAFYHPRAIDPQGGFFHFFKDDGTVYDRHTRHLVSSTRFIFNYAMALRHFGDAGYRQALEHGLQFLREAHRNPASDGYAWLLRRQGDRTEVLESDNYCYGLAFVILAYAHALQAGVSEARAWLEEAYALAEQHFWEPAHGLYADQASADWSQTLPYRGQNANMHMCEALCAAFEATQQPHYLERAHLLAGNITQRQAALAGGLVWEHYHSDWSVDWEYNRNDRNNIFKPWGFQPGHLTEWSKLLLIIERLQRQAGMAVADWLAPRAVELFDTALQRAWDRRHGGLHYGFAPDGSICDGDKYFWVQAETLAAAALLGQRTGKADYWIWYQRLWEYCDRRFIDHDYGAWYRLLSPDNRRLSDEKSPAGKTDYHTMGACYEILPTLPAQ